jgi:hypothetical protein
VSLDTYANPNGVASNSPGLPYSATLGDGPAEIESVVEANPKGVAASGLTRDLPLIIIPSRWPQPLWG